jgi:hypothetical protein
MNTIRPTKKLRQRDAVAEPLESRLFLSAAPLVPHTYVSVAADGSVWTAGGNAIQRLAPNGEMTQYSVPSSAEIPLTITSAAVFTADNSAWVSVSSAGSNWIERLTPAGQFSPATPPTQDPLGLLIAGGSTVWFTEGTNTLGEVSINGTAAAITLPQVTTVKALAVDGSGAAWFAGTTTDNRGFLGSVTVDGEGLLHIINTIPANLPFDPAIALSADGTHTNAVTCSSTNSPGGGPALFPPALVFAASAGLSSHLSVNPPKLLPRTMSAASTLPVAASGRLALASPPSAAIGNPSVFEGEFSIAAANTMPEESKPHEAPHEDDAYSTAAFLPAPAPAKLSVPFVGTPTLPASAAVAAAVHNAPAPARSLAAAGIAVVVESPPLPAPAALSTPPRIAGYPVPPHLLRWSSLAMVFFTGSHDPLLRKTRKPRRRDKTA